MHTKKRGALGNAKKDENRKKKSWAELEEDVRKRLKAFKMKGTLQNANKANQ